MFRALPPTCHATSLKTRALPCRTQGESKAPDAARQELAPPAALYDGHQLINDRKEARMADEPANLTDEKTRPLLDTGAQIEH